MPGAVRCPHPRTHATATATHSGPPTSAEGRDWEPDLRAPAPNVSPSIMWIRSPCIHPRPRGAAAASSPRSAGLKKPKPPLPPSRLRQGPAGPGGPGPRAERAGAPGHPHSAWGWGRPAVRGGPTSAGDNRRVQGPGQASRQAPSQTPGSDWARTSWVCSCKNQASAREGSTPSSRAGAGGEAARLRNPLAGNPVVASGLGTQPFGPAKPPATS